MTFHICGQCQYFERDSHPEDEEQSGECYGFPPSVHLVGDSFECHRPCVDPGDRACAIFKDSSR